MYIFVYGTLKKGDPNHFLLGNSQYICTTRTMEKYVMLDIGAFPGVIKHENTPGYPVTFIHGEVYDISLPTLQKLDDYEGQWYFREEVKLETGTKALMYFLVKIPPLDYKIIPDGNWAR